MTIKTWLQIFFLLVVFSGLVNRVEAADDKFRYPFYVGITGGYGSTTWSGLVPPGSKANSALALSTPIRVSEGGAMWGVVGGYEIIPQFAVELSYSRYPTATVYFSKKSLFSYRNKGSLEFTTNTEDYSFVGKLMLIIPRTTVRVFSSAGVASVHRYDRLANRWRASPTFNAGFNYNFTDHLMAELGANYTGGYGESELTPSDDYVPFLYSAFLRLAYRF
jgi:hypothetical protein